MRNQTSNITRAFRSKVNDAKSSLEAAQRREQASRLWKADLGRAIAKHAPDYLTDGPHIYCWGDYVCIGFNVQALGDLEPLVSACKTLQYWGTEPHVSEDVHQWGAKRTYRFHNLEIEANLAGEAAQCRIVCTGSSERTVTENTYELRCG